MTENLQKIEGALAPTIGPGKRVTCEAFIDPAMLFVGGRLAYLVSQNIDSTCELSVREKVGREVSCTLLRHEHWRVVAKIVALLEANGLQWIRTSDPIALRNQYGKVDTIVDSSSCR
jgi:hypothetical protein